LLVVHEPVDRLRLVEADHDRERPLARLLLEEDVLLVARLADQDAVQDHLGHGGLRAAARPILRQGGRDGSMARWHRASPSSASPAAGSRSRCTRARSPSSSAGMSSSREETLPASSSTAARASPSRRSSSWPPAPPTRTASTTR